MSKSREGQLREGQLREGQLAPFGLHTPTF
jgi:hypothetical protein